MWSEASGNAFAHTSASSARAQKTTAFRKPGWKTGRRGSHCARVRTVHDCQDMSIPTGFLVYEKKSAGKFQPEKQATELHMDRLHMGSMPSMPRFVT